MRRGAWTSPWCSIARESCACMSWISPLTWRCTSSALPSCSGRPARTLDSRRQRRQAMKSTIRVAAALHAGDMLVELQLDPDPPRAGDNILHVDLMDAQGKPIDGAQLGFVYDMAAMGSMPEMKGGGDIKTMSGGKYAITYPLAMQGDWTLTLGVDAPGHPHAELRFKVSPPHKGYSIQTRASRESGPQ